MCNDWMLRSVDVSRGDDGVVGGEWMDSGCNEVCQFADE